MDKKDAKIMFQLLAGQGTYETLAKLSSAYDEGSEEDFIEQYGCNFNEALTAIDNLNKFIFKKQ